jgi:hypothetical protein
MSEPCPVALQIRDSARAPTKATLEIEAIPFGRRLGRGAVRLLFAWVIGVFCVLVPLLHFVLVPGFLIAGPVLAWLAVRATVEVKSASVTCPKCAKEAPIEAGSTGWPVRLRCVACGTTFSARSDPTASRDRPAQDP